MSRGDRRENIFRDDVDRQDFLKTLAKACQKTGFQVHAYCLMGNHLGSEAFRREMLERMEGQLRNRTLGNCGGRVRRCERNGSLRRSWGDWGGQTRNCGSYARVIQPSWPWRRDCGGRRR
jgi:hypothetical protein